jgi:hypothetical protein
MVVVSSPGYIPEDTGDWQARYMRAMTDFLPAF